MISFVSQETSCFRTSVPTSIYGIRGDFPAVGAGAVTALGGSIRAQGRRAGGAGAGMFAVHDLVQVAAGCADQHVQRVALVLGQQVAGEKVEILVAMSAVVLFYPKEIFDMGLVGVAFQASGSVQVADLSL